MNIEGYFAVKGRFWPYLAIIVILTCWTATEIIYHNFSSIEDHKIFPNRELKASKATYHFTCGLDDTKVPKKINYGDKTNTSLEEFLESNKTVAFLVIKHDTIIL